MVALRFSIVFNIAAFLKDWHFCKHNSGILSQCYGDTNGTLPAFYQCKFCEPDIATKDIENFIQGKVPPIAVVVISLDKKSYFRELLGNSIAE